jgi:hypothetical protein
MWWTKWQWNSFYQVFQVSPDNIIPLGLSISIYHTRISNRTVGCRSSETSSRPIDTNNNNELIIIRGTACNKLYLGSKFCPSVLETVGLRVPTRHLRDFPLFYVCPTIKNRPSARCASAANVVCKDFDIFRRHNVSLEHILF